MKDTSWTLDAMKAATNRAEGNRWTPEGAVEIPFTKVFPYDFHGAGDINSNIEDMARWVRLQLANGEFEGRRIVSAEALAFTRTPKVANKERVSYAYGWSAASTQNGTAITHDGSTAGFGAFVGLLPDRDVGVIVLSNEEDKGLPSSTGFWFLDRVLQNPNVDYAAITLKGVTESHERLKKLFTRPENPSPSAPLATLAGTFSHPGLGKAVVKPEGDVLIAEIEASGAHLKLAPWSGDTFVASLVPEGKFADVAAMLGPMPMGFVQFQIDKDAKLDRFRFIYQDNGQPFDFKRE
jgi:hypothetical protein